MSEEITRREFLRTGGGVLVSTALPDLSELASDAEKVRIVNAIGECNKFMLDHGKHFHKRLAEDIYPSGLVNDGFKLGVSFFPPLADFVILNEVGEEIGNNWSETSLGKIKEAFEKIVDEKLSDFSLPPGWRPMYESAYSYENVLGRWETEGKFKSREKSRSLALEAIASKIPTTGSVKLEEDTLGGYSEDGNIVMGDEKDDFLIDASKEELRRVLQTIFLHEEVHTLDITANPKILRFVRKKKLGEIMDLYFDAVAGIKQLPSHDGGFAEFDHYHDYDSIRGDLELYKRSVFGDFNQMTSAEMKNQANVYPEKRIGTNWQQIDDLVGAEFWTEQKELLYLSLFSLGCKEYVAELGAAYLSLKLGVMGEEKNQKLIDELENEPAIKYVNAVLDELDYHAAQAISNK